MTQYVPHSYSDIQGDMARHDEEGSGYRDDIDDDDYGSISGSGDGSGDGKFTYNILNKMKNNIFLIQFFFFLI